MGAKNSNEIRGDRKAEALGTLAGWAMRVWTKTLRVEVEDRCGVTQPGKLPEPVIYALWHNRIFVVPPVWMRSCGAGRKAVVLASASKDGAILSNAVGACGIGAVRGSSSRRAIAGLIGMKRALQDGLDICLTPDGPRGPRYAFQPGVVKLAETSGAPIVPVHVRFSAAWRLKTWDRLVIPKPFSRITVTFGERVAIPPKLDAEAFQAQLDRVQAILLTGVDDT